MIMYLLMMLTAAIVTYAATWGARLVGNKMELYSPDPQPGHALDAGLPARRASASLPGSWWPWSWQAIPSSSRTSSGTTRRPGASSPAPRVIVLVGVADDLLDLRWWVKLIGQSAAALVVAIWGVRMTVIPFIPEPLVIQNEAVSIVLTAGLIVTTMNAFNFIDGLDGLAAGVAIIGGAAFFLTAYWVHRTAVLLDRSDLATLLTAIVVGSCVGFLPHNWFPSKIFMGDSGAMLIGLLMASAGVVSTGQITSGLYDRANGIPTVIPILLAVRGPVPAAAGPVPGGCAADRAGPFAMVRGPRAPAPQAPGHRLLAPQRRRADVPVDLHSCLRRPRVRDLPLAHRPRRRPGRRGRSWPW